MQPGNACKNVSATSPRATSPFNIKARVKRRREKRLEKQANLTIGLDDCQNPVYPGPDYSHQLSPGLPVVNCGVGGGEGRTSPASRTSPCLTPAGSTASPCRSPSHCRAPHPQAVQQAPPPLLKERLSSSFRFKDLRKKGKDSLSFRRTNKHHTTVDAAGGAPGNDNFLGISYHSAGTSPEARSPRSPVSPGQCKCRRCSFLPLEECEPKEVSALFKFLRKSKVGRYWTFLSKHSSQINPRPTICYELGL